MAISNVLRRGTLRQYSYLSNSTVSGHDTLNADNSQRFPLLHSIALRNPSPTLSDCVLGAAAICERLRIQKYHGGNAVPIPQGSYVLQSDRGSGRQA